MTSTLSDNEAIRRSLRQPEAFVAIFERHHPAVHNYLRRRLGPGLADDLAAEALTRAFRDRGSYRPQGESARPWLLGIVANLIADHRRSEGRALRALQRAGPDPDAEAGGDASDLAPELVAGLRRLPRGEREALLLLAWGELTYTEIAEALAIPVGTVRSRIHNARRRMSGVAAPDHTPLLGEAHA